MEIDTHPWIYPKKPSDKPCVSQLARFQAHEGARVTSLRHQAVDLDDEGARRLLLLLDGTRDRKALIEQSGLTGATVAEYLKKLSSLSLLMS